MTERYFHTQILSLVQVAVDLRHHVTHSLDDAVVNPDDGMTWTTATTTKTGKGTKLEEFQNSTM